MSNKVTNYIQIIVEDKGINPAYLAEFLNSSEGKELQNLSK